MYRPVDSKTEKMAGKLPVTSHDMQYWNLETVVQTLPF